MNTRTSRAFTLVEIMIVVLIIGILLAIAIPNFIKARETSRARTCIANLRQIDAAKDQWRLEKYDPETRPKGDPNQTDLSPVYVKNWPVCPSGGAYKIDDVWHLPTCSIPGHRIP